MEATYELVVSNIDKFTAVIVLVGCSLYLRFILESFGQTWVRTKAHTGTLIFLPLIVYVITNVISGNIALSLGMVGALSIVRFRNPVRSPIELAAYFCAITLGIASAVSMFWTIFLVASVTFGILVLALVNKLLCIAGYNALFVTSFSEGNMLSTLNVRCSSEVDFLNSSDLLISKNSHEGSFEYTFSSAEFDVLRRLESDCLFFEGVMAIELRK